MSNKIINNVRKQGRGCIFTPKDFIDFGTRQAVDTALSRLVARGDVRRLSRGLYDYPKKHRLLGDLLPSLDVVAQAIAKDTDSDIQISGARALHLLGLTTQVPAKVVYLTSGISKTVQIGNAALMLKHAGPRIMAGAGSKAGTILQAIRYLGKNSVNDDILARIARQINREDKRSLKTIARYAPGWAKPSIDKLIAA